MAKFDIFSKRNNKKTSDVYIYDDISNTFRVQIIHIWDEAIGSYETDGWDWIKKTLCKEYGVFTLSNRSHHTSLEQCQYFIQICKTEEVLDLVELTFSWIDKIIRDRYSPYSVKQSPDDAIQELNDRFSEHSLGYQYIEGSIVRIDSQFLHQEAIKPLIHLLHDEKFKGAEEEFFKAHEHYLHKRNKEAINECLKAFESCLKEICTREKWLYPPNATAIALLKIVIEDNNLIPQELTAHFTALRSTLKDGVPTIRNKTSGHGQGEKPTIVPSYLVAYTLNIAASAMLLLVNAYKESK
jgi:hypothetical protein